MLRDTSEPGRRLPERLADGAKQSRDAQFEAAGARQALVRPPRNAHLGRQVARAHIL